MTLVVKISDVIHTPGWKENPRSTRKCQSVLQRQGMIEPLTVTQIEKAPYLLDGKNVHHDDLLAAAAVLEWDTVIIALADKGLY